MKRRDFAKTRNDGCPCIPCRTMAMATERSNEPGGEFYEEPAKNCASGVRRGDCRRRHRGRRGRVGRGAQGARRR